MDYHAVPAFLAELRQHEDSAARALEFLILCASRSGEVLGARWNEVDLVNAVWTVPASRMKARREHRVPLAPAAVALLATLPREAEHVFIGMKAGCGLSHMAMRRVMERLQRLEAIHGFRASFRSWSAAETNFPREVCEHALAHVVGSQTERAYERGDSFAKRRALMAAWARYCTAPPVAQTGAVVPIRR